MYWHINLKILTQNSFNEAHYYVAVDVCPYILFFDYKLLNTALLAEHII